MGLSLLVFYAIVFEIHAKKDVLTSSTENWHFAYSRNVYTNFDFCTFFVFELWARTDGATEIEGLCNDGTNKMQGWIARLGNDGRPTDYLVCVFTLKMQALF